MFTSIQYRIISFYFNVYEYFLTIAEAFLVTLMGSPLLVMGMSDRSMMYRQASRTPKLNYKENKTLISQKIFKIINPEALVFLVFLLPVHSSSFSQRRHHRRRGR